MSITDNPSSVADEKTFAVRRTIRIAAPIDKVWSAITVPEHISQWFGRVVINDVRIGATGTITWPERHSIPLRIEALDAPRMITYRWCNDDASGTAPDEIVDEHSTVFTFTLHEIGDGTQLTVVETGFETTSDPLANLHSHRDGWTGELDKLVALLEGAR